MIPKYAILNEKREVVPVDDCLTWAKAFEERDRIVKQTSMEGIKVSTVFLGLNHAWGPSQSPQWFETMIFGGPRDGFQMRCETWDQAVAQHDDAVSKAEVPHPSGLPITKVPETEEAAVLLAAHEKSQMCEHGDCMAEAVYEDYCEEHAEHYFCECGQRLEDATGTPGDGFCVRCR